jgi:hypothetical protein
MNKFVGNMLDTPNQYMCYVKLGTSNSFCVPIYIYIYECNISFFFFFFANQYLSCDMNGVVWRYSIDWRD